MTYMWVETHLHMLQRSNSNTDKQLCWQQLCVSL